MINLFGSGEAKAVLKAQFSEFTRKQKSVLFLAFTVQKAIISGKLPFFHLVAFFLRIFIRVSAISVVILLSKKHSDLLIIIQTIP
jgi:hypothetical protein